MRKKGDEKDNIIAMLRDQNSNITRKNVQMEKDLRRGEMALAECIFEKSEATKEINAQREALDDVIKQNTVLNEELKVKTEIIKAISQNNEEPGVNQEETSTKPSTTNNKEARKEAKRSEDFKCNECSFVTSGEILLMDHIISHSIQIENPGERKHSCPECAY